MRNLFQVNVEEGRHLWAMVYLLQKYFGRDGREEAEELLRRRSGDPDTPRMLGAFNEATPDWLSFFMFTFFTDRDGKMQLAALAQSGFDPLSRTCRFMLTEEAHHMFVGDTGVRRIIERTCAAMRAAGIDDPTDIERVRGLGVIDLPTLQKKANLHFSLTLDLFGNEISTNAANAFNAGLKGRYREDKLGDDHQLLADTYPVLRYRDGAVVEEQCPCPLQPQHAAARRLRRRLRSGIARWNKVIETAGYRFPPDTAARRLQPPHRRVRRPESRHRGAHSGRSGMGRAARNDAAVVGRQRLRRQPDAPGAHPRRLRRLDRAAEGRHRQQAGGFRVREARVATKPYVSPSKKSLPLSSITMNAGKSSTSMRQIASIPSSGYSSRSTLRMWFCARPAAAPPMLPR